MVKYAITTWMNKSSFCVKPNWNLFISHTTFNCKDIQHLDSKDDTKTQIDFQVQVTHFGFFIAMD
jgi:hypothetical protein